MSLRADPQLTAAYHAALSNWDAARATDRLWAKDASLWTGTTEASWLGWLDAPASDAELGALARQVLAAVPRHAHDVLVIGMGGSSLAAEVIARTIPLPGHTFHILDTTEPGAARDILSSIRWEHTAIVVASKSGTTLEPDLLLTFALDAARKSLGDYACKHVIAITDPGSRLAREGARLGFGDVVLGDPTIGGRYSALSPFGLVPAALCGVDLPRFARSARAMAVECHERSSENPGVQLGVFLAEASRAGRDKCTLILPPSLEALGAWIEQLLAESIGKNGRLILPVDGESLAEPDVYGDDRAFVHVRDDSTPDAHQVAIDDLVAAGHAVFAVDVGAAPELAGEFFRWEFATAVAGAMLGVNSFDQPDVEASKVATRALMESSASVADGGGASLESVLASVKPGDYVALLAYLPMWEPVQDALQQARELIRAKLRVATSVGFGPRYLHSTGQAFKGGPNTGVFVQLTRDVQHDVDVPGTNRTLGAVVAAQAAGDRAVLRDRGRRVAHIHLRGDLDRALAEFERALRAALSSV